MQLVEQEMRLAERSRSLPSTTAWDDVILTRGKELALTVAHPTFPNPTDVIMTTSVPWDVEALREQGGVTAEQPLQALPRTSARYSRRSLAVRAGMQMSGQLYSGPPGSA